MASTRAILVTTSPAALSPCTTVGNKVISAIGYRLFTVVIISRITAPLGLVKTAIFLGYLGKFFLGAKNKPSLSNFAFNCS